ncbi:MAG: serine hydrolase, partial [Patescibacteria group bacterium]
MKRNFLALFLGIGAAVLILNFPTFNGGERGQPADVSLSNSETSDVRQTFEDINLEAKSVYVFDVKENREIFSLNAEEKLPLASLTKLMTAIVAEENIPSYVLIPISKNAIAREGDSGLTVEERWPVFDLIDVMLISSSNDAAYALAESFEGGFGGFVVSKFFLLNIPL